MIVVLRRLFPPLALFWAAALPVAAAVHAAPPDNGGVRLFASAVYAAGAVVCHQRAERSFEWTGEPWPVCARCTGIYVGAAVAALVLLAEARRSGASDSTEGRGGAGDAPLRAEEVMRARIVCVAAVVPTVATIVWEWTTGRPSSNELRALAGIPIGIAVAWVLLRRTPSRSHSG
jgi:uncharacterized membrane protein